MCWSRLVLPGLCQQAASDWCELQRRGSAAIGEDAFAENAVEVADRLLEAAGLQAERQSAVVDGWPLRCGEERGELLLSGMCVQDCGERLGGWLGRVGVRAEVSVGLVEQRLAERRGALGLVAG
jgi:hypothetical protein